MGTADADKKDVITECERQLSDNQTYLEITQEELSNLILEIQNKLKNITNSHLYKGKCSKKEHELIKS